MLNAGQHVADENDAHGQKHCGWKSWHCKTCAPAALPTMHTSVFLGLLCPSHESAVLFCCVYFVYILPSDRQKLCHPVQYNILLLLAKEVPPLPVLLEPLQPLACLPHGPSSLAARASSCAVGGPPLDRY